MREIVRIGCGAGFMNVPKIKGSHTAMKSGMLAAEAAFEALQAAGEGEPAPVLAAYPEAFRQSWVHDELWRARNARYLQQQVSGARGQGNSETPDA